MKTEKWTNVTTQARTAFKITGRGRDADAGIGNAEADGALFALRAGQSKARGSCVGVRFRLRDVEPLLDQASFILDRAQSDLAAAQTLGEKYATLKCELDQFFALDQILEDEEEAGKYSVPHDLSEAQLNGSKKLKEALGKATTAKVAQRKKWWEDARIVIRAGALAYYRAQYAGAIAGTAPASNDPDEPAPGGEGLADIDRKISREQADFDRINHVDALDMEIGELSGQSDSVTKNQEGLEKREAWDKKNIEFLTARANRLRQLMRQKAALTVSGDFLDFRSRMEQITMRYQQQLADAYLRLEAVNKGMVTLYDYRRDGKPDPLPALTDQPESFEEILAWTRRAAAWLAAFTRRCNNYVLPISIRRLATDWVDGRETGKWTFNIKPDLVGDKKLFGDKERHVRIRGICGWSSNKDGPFMLDVSPPGKSKVRYESGEDSPEFEQEIKSCRIGRVLQRKASPVPEVSGITALYNASPFGEWTVQAVDPISGKNDWPSDFQLDLYLSVLTL